MSENNKTGILNHIRELRVRLIWCVAFIFIFTDVFFWQSDWLFGVLKQPAGDIQFVYIEVTEGFSTYMKVSFIAGIIAAMPVIMYNLLMFIIPALNKREKRLVLLILPWILIMFFGGVYFGYMFLVPPATQFLLGFGAETALVQPRLSNYVNFVIQLLLVIGLIFELPVVTTFLTRIGIISHKWLARKRKIWIVMSFVISAVITPTPDAINQTIVAATLVVLFEISIWLAWLVDKKRNSTTISDD